MSTDARYYRLSPKFWADPRVLAWNDDQRLLALYLLTCPHRTTEGLFRLPKLYAQADLGWTAERFDEPFAKLTADGFIDYDDDAQVVLIRAALKYQAPDNDNMVKHAVKALVQLPPTRLASDFRQLAEQYAERLAKGLPEGFAKGFGEPVDRGLGNPPSKPAQTVDEATTSPPRRSTTTPTDSLAGAATATRNPAAAEPVTSDNEPFPKRLPKPLAEPIGNPPAPAPAPAPAPKASRMRATAEPPAQPPPEPSPEPEQRHPDQATRSQQLIAGYLDRCTKRPPSQVLGKLAKAIKALVDEGYEDPPIQAALQRLQAKGLDPSVLPSVLNEVLNATPIDHRNRGQPTPRRDDALQDMWLRRANGEDVPDPTRTAPIDLPDLRQIGPGP